ncbi:MAG: Lrp/AsnC family transcriptional regulator [Clostridia bacterium]|nr:Lrp/AsnC family transcriptional regulator [Clostridia bacterium]
MRPELLKLLSNNARYTIGQLSDMLGESEENIKNEIKALENEGVICGYKAVIDWDSLDGSLVSAIIEIKVVPKADLGFEEVAEKILELYREKC